MLCLNVKLLNLSNLFRHLLFNVIEREMKMAEKLHKALTFVAAVVQKGGVDLQGLKDAFVSETFNDKQAYVVGTDDNNEDENSIEFLTRFSQLLTERDKSAKD